MEIFCCCCAAFVLLLSVCGYVGHFFWHVGVCDKGFRNFKVHLEETNALLQVDVRPTVRECVNSMSPIAVTIIMSSKILILCPNLLESPKTCVFETLKKIRLLEHLCVVLRTHNALSFCVT